MYRHNLTPNLREKTLKDMETGLTVKAKVRKASLIGISSFDRSSTIADILAEFTEISKLSTHIVKPRHGVRHQIETFGKSVYEKPRCLPADKLKIAKAEF